MANDKRLLPPYNSEEPLKSLVEILNKCKDFAASGDPVTNTQIIQIAHGLVAKTDHYKEYCRAWYEVKEKTWSEFQAPFIESQSDLRERQKMVRQGGYRSNILMGIEEDFSNLYQAKT